MNGLAPELISGSRLAVSMREATEVLAQTARSEGQNLHDLLTAYSGTVRNAAGRVSNADSSGADLAQIASGTEPRGPWLIGWDGNYRHFTFEPRHVRSMPLLDHEGKIFGVSFPTHHTGYNADRKAYRTWSQMPNRLSDTEFVPEIRSDRAGNRNPNWRDRGPALPAPWAADAQDGALFVHAHAGRRGFEVEVNVGTDDDPDWRILLAPERFFGHILAANQHFQAASRAAPRRPLVMLCCHAGNPEYGHAQGAAEVLHGEGLRHDVHATIAQNWIGWSKENGTAGVIVEVPVGSSPTDAVVTIRAPREAAPPVGTDQEAPLTATIPPPAERRSGMDALPPTDR
ncbi:hypothetical protein [Nocardia testacea]|uniref:hypothetical protein n=1 Tax=Nocardia testacea TaxID=248551 RepID=UPI00058449B2|nr:hypothetical protein [Nocardia testacea]